MWLPRPSRAMTLIEIMMAIMIVALMTAVVAPRVAGSSTRGKVRAVARELGSLCRMARATAVMTETEVELLFAPDRGRYQLVYDYVEIERHRWVERGRQGRRREIRDRDLEARASARHHEMMRVRVLPINGSGVPMVRFALTDTEVEVPHPTERREDIPAIIFFPDGTASGAQIVVEGLGGEKMSLEIYTATGLVEITEGDVRMRDRGEW